VCGIAGIVGAYPDRDQAVRQMIARLAHRGPDDEGLFADEHAALGHRRLSILDLTAAGHQPMKGERAWISLNGEIYNFAELRAELEARGHRFRSRSDTEVVIRLWEEEGDACLARLRGMFALAIWDPPARRLLLARDHFGQKPLYWAQAGGALLFASEMKALAPLVPAAVDPAGIDAFLSLGVVPSPSTCTAAIRRLPPATLLELRPGEAPRLRRWWQPARRAIQGDVFEEVDAHLRRAVKEQLVADVPVGLFLSGGIDSSLILANAPSGITAFSVGFVEPGYDELPHARQVASGLGAKHETLVVSADEARDPEKLLDVFDEPFADPAALAVLALSRAARGQVKVVLTGDGGDEVFGGYGYHLGALWMSRLPGHGWQAPLARAALRLTPRSQRLRSRLHTLRHAFEILSAPTWQSGVALLRANLAPEDRAALYQPEFAARVGDGGYARLEPEHLVSAVDDPVLADRFLYKNDHATMSAGLEGRCPYLDVPLAELAASLPPTVHIRGRQGKRIPRRLLARSLGEGVARRRKTGLSLPVGAWLRGPLAPLMRDTLLRPDARVRAIVRPAELDRRAAEHAAGAADHRRTLWPLLLLELWLRRGRSI